MFLKIIQRPTHKYKLMTMMITWHEFCLYPYFRSDPTDGTNFLDLNHIPIFFFPPYFLART